jgi:hypothetical protein
MATELTIFQQMHARARHFATMCFGPRSSRGLGRAFTEAALNAGHRVVATARNSDHLTGIASKFGESVQRVLRAELVSTKNGVHYISI